MDCLFYTINDIAMILNLQKTMVKKYLLQKQIMLKLEKHVKKIRLQLNQILHRKEMLKLH